MATDAPQIEADVLAQSRDILADRLPPGWVVRSSPQPPATMRQTADRILELIAPDGTAAVGTRSKTDRQRA
jgi:hypothetical protein